MSILGHVTINPENVSHYFVYSVHSNSVPTECVYVGYDVLAQALILSSPRSSPLFDKREQFTIILHSAHDSRVTASNIANTLARQLCETQQYMPKFNVGSRNNRSLEVICEQTGKHWQNAFQACKALGIDQPRMSKHLARKKGFKTINGQSFRYVAAWDNSAKSMRPIDPTAASGVTSLTRPRDGMRFDFYNGECVAIFNNIGAPVPVTPHQFPTLDAQGLADLADRWQRESSTPPLPRVGE